MKKGLSLHFGEDVAFLGGVLVDGGCAVDVLGLQVEVEDVLGLALWLGVLGAGGGLDGRSVESEAALVVFADRLALSGGWGLEEAGGCTGVLELFEVDEQLSDDCAGLLLWLLEEVVGGFVSFLEDVVEGFSHVVLDGLGVAPIAFTAFPLGSWSFVLEIQAVAHFHKGGVGEVFFIALALHFIPVLGFWI